MVKNDNLCVEVCLDRGSGRVVTWMTLKYTNYSISQGCATQYETNFLFASVLQKTELIKDAVSRENIACFLHELFFSGAMIIHIRSFGFLGCDITNNQGGILFDLQNFNSHMFLKSLNRIPTKLVIFRVHQSLDLHELGTLP